MVVCNVDSVRAPPDHGCQSNACLLMSRHALCPAAVCIQLLLHYCTMIALAPFQCTTVSADVCATALIGAVPATINAGSLISCPRQMQCAGVCCVSLWTCLTRSARLVTPVQWSHKYDNSCVDGPRPSLPLAAALRPFCPATMVAAQGTSSQLAAPC